MEGRNPCDVCKHYDNCEDCYLDRVWVNKGTCYNSDCFVNNSDCGCLLSLDDVCKASTAYREEKK